MIPYGRPPPLPRPTFGRPSGPGTIPYGRPPPLPITRPVFNRPVSNPEPPKQPEPVQEPVKEPTPEPDHTIEPSETIEKVDQQPTENNRPVYIYIGRIPTAITDDILEELLQHCGELKEWKRMTDAFYRPQTFGFALFENMIAGAVAFKFLNSRNANKWDLVEDQDDSSDLELPEPLKKLKVSPDSFLKKYLEQENQDITTQANQVILKSKEILEPISKSQQEPEPRKPVALIEPKREPVRFDDSYDSQEEEEKRQLKKKRDLLALFAERERRWESHEQARQRKLERDESRSDAKRAAQMLEMLELFDDDVEKENQNDEFYRDKQRWIHKRLYFAKREAEMDQRDYELELKELENPHLKSEIQLQKVKEEEPEVPAARIMTVEERKQAITNLISTIPTEKQDLFEYQVKWNVLDKNLIEEQFRNFISKKTVEYLGQEEESVIEFVVEMLESESKPREMVSKLQDLLDEDTEMFVIKLWRMLIFETEGRHQGIC